MNFLSNLKSKVTSAAKSLVSPKVNTTRSAFAGAVLSALVGTQNAQAYTHPIDVSDNLRNIGKVSQTYYVVKKNDSLQKIADKFGLSLEELVGLNPRFKNRKNSIYPNEIVYLVDRESVLGGIKASLNKNTNPEKTEHTEAVTTVETLAANDITYTVGTNKDDVKGIFHIAKKRLGITGLTEAEIKSYNPDIKNINLIKVGQTINFGPAKVVGIDLDEIAPANNFNYEGQKIGETVTVKLEDSPVETTKVEFAKVKTSPVKTDDPKAILREEFSERYKEEPVVSTTIPEDEMKVIDKEIEEATASNNNIQDLRHTTLENISEKKGDYYVITGKLVSGYNLNDFIPKEIRVVHVVSNGRKQLLYRESFKDDFKPANLKGIGDEIGIFRGTKIKLYTEQDLKDKKYLAVDDRYASFSVEKRFETYFERDEKNPKKIRAKLPTKKLVNISRLDDMIPDNYSLLAKVNGARELIVRVKDERTGDTKFQFANPHLAKVKVPKVFDGSEFMLMEASDVVRERERLERVFALGARFGEVIGDNYHKLPKSYKTWNDCGKVVKALVKSKQKVSDLPDGGMHGYRWSAELDRLTALGWYEKIYVGEPENAPVGSLLAYNKGYGSDMRKQYGHVDLKTAEGYAHGKRLMDRPGGSLDHVKSKRKSAGFTGYAYVPKKIGEEEIAKYAHILPGVEVTMPAESVVVAMSNYVEQKASPKKVDAVHPKSSVEKGQGFKNVEAQRDKIRAKLTSITDDNLRASIESKLRDRPVSALVENLKSELKVSSDISSMQTKVEILLKNSDNFEVKLKAKRQIEILAKKKADSQNRIRQINAIIEDVTGERVADYTFAELVREAA